jgi:cobyric acid synthase
MIDYTALRDRSIDRLADCLETHLDMQSILGLLS